MQVYPAVGRKYSNFSYTCSKFSYIISLSVYYQNKVFLTQAKLSLFVSAIPVLEMVKSMVATQILLAALVIFVAMDTIRDNTYNLYIFS